MSRCLDRSHCISAKLHLGDSADLPGDKPLQPAYSCLSIPGNTQSDREVRARRPCLGPDVMDPLARRANLRLEG